jgi:hypothetical protein
MQLNFAVREADYLKADSLYRRLPPPRQDTLQYRTMDAFAKGDVARQEALYRAYEADTVTNATNISFRLIHDMENPDAAARFATLALKEANTDPRRARAAAEMAGIEAERGQMRAALTRLRGATLRDPRRVYTEFASMPLYRIPAEHLAAMRAEIERSDSIPRNSELTEQVRPHIRLYRLAQMSCRAGDYAAANAYAQRIRAMSAPAVYRNTMALIADEIDAQVDVANGRYGEAVEKLARHKYSVAADLGNPLTWAAGAAAWHAEALFQAGRYEEARKRFDTLDDALATSAPHTSYILLRRAQIADAQNDAAKARDLYARFLKFWTQPDPELQPVVDQARARLAQLQSNAG